MRGLKAISILTLFFWLIFILKIIRILSEFINPNENVKVQSDNLFDPIYIYLMKKRMKKINMPTYSYFICFFIYLHLLFNNQFIYVYIYIYIYTYNDGTLTLAFLFIYLFTY